MSECKPLALGKVDCTLHEMVCRNNHIQGYPSIRIFTKVGWCRLTASKPMLKAPLVLVHEAII